MYSCNHPLRISQFSFSSFLLIRLLPVKNCISLCLLLLSGSVASAFGLIGSFAPISAPVGATVTIMGDGFAGTATDNIVYFGTVRGTVISATQNELKVIVPAGASHRPLSVTTGGLTFYSRLPFVPTFENTGPESSYISFLPKEVLLQTNRPFSVAPADFDGDGRLDLAVAENIASNNVTVDLAVYKNILVGDSTTFSDRLFITSGITANLNSSDIICVADIDGDGKLDLAVSRNDNVVWVFRNTSILGNISFDEGHPFEVSLGMYQTGVINVGDLNFDGKPDLMTGSGRSNFFSILVNTSTPGIISFQDNQAFNIGSWGVFTTDVFEVTAADFTGDGKPDLILSGQQNDRFLGIKAKIVILENVGNTESLAFSMASSQLLNTFLLYKLNLADFNNDGRIDIVCKFTDEVVFHVFKNTSVYPSTSYDIVDFPAPLEAINISAADVDGDGKPDVVLNKTNAVSVYKNNSSQGSITFAGSVDFKSNGVKYLTVSDMDADGKPEITCVNTDAGNLSTLKYSGLWRGDTYLCPNGETTLVSYTAGNLYQWQMSTDSGKTFTNIINNNYYNGAETDKLLLTSVPTSFYNYQYRCLVNGATSKEIYVLKFINIWLGIYDNEWANPTNWSCGVLPDANTDVEVEAGTVLLNANYSCRSLTVKSGATVTVGAGYTLTITH